MRIFGGVITLITPPKYISFELSINGVTRMYMECDGWPIAEKLNRGSLAAVRNSRAAVLNSHAAVKKGPTPPSNLIRIPRRCPEPRSLAAVPISVSHAAVISIDVNSSSLKNMVPSALA